MLRLLVSRSSARTSRCAAARALHGSTPSQALSKFTMPAMSPTMTEGGLSSWKKKEGETFAPGDVLLEIETDKATMDVEAQEEGSLVKILVSDGSKGVEVGKVIAIMAEEGDDVSDAEVQKLLKEVESEGGQKKEDDAAEPATEAKADDQPQKKAAEQSAKESGAPATQSGDTKSSDKQQSAGSNNAESSSQAGPREYIFATPVAKRLASEKGLALKDIKGSGPNGRIIKSDVENYKAPSKAAAPSSSSSASASSSSSSSKKAASTSTPSSPASGAAELPYTDIPVSNMRKVIGQRLLESKQNVPHYYVTAEIRVDRLMKLREVFNNAAKKASEGGNAGPKAVKLSVNDFIVKAAALALQEVPEANSAWLGDTIRQYHKADISVAVATPTGLITPIVKDAGSRGLASISTATKELVKKARDNKLKPDEYQGGTFTISNLGMFGVTNFTAIINPPQACILAVGTNVEKVVSDPESEKGFKAIQVMEATLSADHRVVDGAVGAKWMKAFKDLLENPLTFIL